MRYSKQRFFDIAYKGIIEQGRPSIGEYGCRYRGPNNTKCAIGLFIPDKLYTKAMDSGMVTVEVMRQAKIGADMELASSIQQAHDESSCEIDFVKSFKLYMARIAEKYKLKIPA